MNKKQKKAIHELIAKYSKMSDRDKKFLDDYPNESISMRVKVKSHMHQADQIVAELQSIASLSDTTEQASPLSHGIQGWVSNMRFNVK